MSGHCPKAYPSRSRARQAADNRSFDTGERWYPSHRCPECAQFHIQDTKPIDETKGRNE